MTNELHIAIVQMEVDASVEKNYERVSSFIEKASGTMDIIAFPEAVLASQDNYKQIATVLEENPYIQKLCKKAKECNIAILLGSIAEISPECNKYWNTLVFITDQGEIKATYRKQHICLVRTPDCVLDETLTTLAGNESVSCDYKGFKLGFTICHDLRFPCVYTALRKKEVEVAFVPSAFAYETGKIHWHPLLAARSIEQQMYMVAPNQCGNREGRYFYGNSVAYSPWGEKLNEIQDGEGMFSVTIKKNYVSEIRSFFH